ncbi:hypothetical protein [Deinococcus aluminii]|uniref:DUF3168 domain-containing protein n=1 Tax=Deinococcus aluminii TaxID=1656885 RepID=A0ABP9XEB3_9DEIO
MARRLTDEVEALFYHPRGGPSREELREHTTVQFVPYGEADLFIGGRTPDERGTPDVTVELSDWSMSVRQRRRVAARLTPVLASLFGVPQNRLDSVNLRFHPYPPRDFAVGGRLLSDRVPRIGQVLKKLLG